MFGNTSCKLLQILNSHNYNNKRIFDVLIIVESFYSKERIKLLQIFELNDQINF